MKKRNKREVAGPPHQTCEKKAYTPGGHAGFQSVARGHPPRENPTTEAITYDSRSLSDHSYKLERVVSTLTDRIKDWERLDRGVRNDLGYASFNTKILKFKILKITLNYTTAMHCHIEHETI